MDTIEETLQLMEEEEVIDHEFTREFKGRFERMSLPISGEKFLKVLGKAYMVERGSLEAHRELHKQLLEIATKDTHTYQAMPLPNTFGSLWITDAPAYIETHMKNLQSVSGHFYQKGIISRSERNEINARIERDQIFEPSLYLAELLDIVASQ